MAQVDITPGTGPTGLNLQFHGPAGASASQVNNPADFPVSKNGPSIVVKIAPANGGPRFANPA
jgi:hypothetical protein